MFTNLKAIINVIYSEVNTSNSWCQLIENAIYYCQLNYCSEKSAFPSYCQHIFTPLVEYGYTEYHIIEINNKI